MPTALQIDPSRTGLLRRGLAARLKVLLRRLYAALRVLVKTEDSFGLKSMVPVYPSMGSHPNAGRTGSLPAGTANQQWQFLLPDEQLKQFEQWLTSQLGSMEADALPVVREYARLAFTAGLRHTYQQAKPALRLTAAAIPTLLPLLPAQATEDYYVAQALGKRQVQARLDALTQRIYNELQAADAKLRAGLLRTLQQSVAVQASPTATLQAMQQQLDKAVGSVTLIVRTEIVRIQADGQLAGMAELGVGQVRLQAEWSTAQDDKVCSLCQPLEGILFTVAEAVGLIPRHPNCRCGWVAEPNKRRVPSKAQQAIADSQAATAKASLDWPPAPVANAAQDPAAEFSKYLKQLGM